MTLEWPAMQDAFNRLSKVIEDQTYTPWAMKVNTEYYAQQDLDGDQQIFGHDICIAELDKYPPSLRGLVQTLERAIAENRIVAIPAASYINFIRDPRDIAAVVKIFGLTPPTTPAPPPLPTV